MRERKERRLWMGLDDAIAPAAFTTRAWLKREITYNM